MKYKTSEYIMHTTDNVKLLLLCGVCSGSQRKMYFLVCLWLKYLKVMALDSKGCKDRDGVCIWFTTADLSST